MNMWHDVGVIAGAVASAIVAALAVAKVMVQRGADRDEREHVERKTEAREETARHRIDAGERARADAVLERQLDAERGEHSDCRKTVESLASQLRESRDETAAARVEVAECKRDRTYLHSLVQWLRGRLDKIDGGSIPPPPPLPDPDMEPAE